MVAALLKKQTMAVTKEQIELLSGTTKESVYDKVFRFYGPMLRENNNSCSRT